MAFDKTEQEILSYGKANGKSEQEVRRAIDRYRLGVPATVDPAPEPEGRPAIQDFAIGAVKETVSGAKDVGDMAIDGATNLATRNIPGGREAVASVVQPIKETIQGAVGLTPENLDPTNTAQQAGGYAAIAASLASPLLMNKAAQVASKIKAVAPKIPGKDTATLAGQVMRDVVPTTAVLRDRTLARGLRLAPIEDIATIEQLTGNKLGDFMARNELIKDTPEQTMDALSKFQKENYNLIREAISLVPERFTFEDIPELKTTIDFLIEDLTPRKSAEYQDALATLKDIQTKGDFDLTQAQYVKSLFDDVESIYKRTGDVRDAVVAQDKAQVIAPVRRFIEERVKEVYPEINLRDVNNNVQTSRAILDAVIKRSAKADTESFFKLGDLAIIGVGNAQAPAAGYGALFVKKVFEAAPLQLRLARWLGGRSKNATEVTNGLDSAQLKKLHTLVREELEKAMKEGDTETAAQLKAIQRESQSTTPTNTRKDNASMQDSISPNK